MVQIRMTKMVCRIGKIGKVGNKLPEPYYLLIIGGLIAALSAGYVEVLVPGVNGRTLLVAAGMLLISAAVSYSWRGL
jgi:hypothetical protein